MDKQWIIGLVLISILFGIIFSSAGLFGEFGFYIMWLGTWAVLTSPIWITIRLTDRVRVRKPSYYWVPIRKWKKRW